MVVDDHRMVADGLATVMGADLGLEVVGCAGSARPRFARRSACLIDAVVVDLRLPDIGGVELVRRLRAAVPGFPPC